VLAFGKWPVLQELDLLRQRSGMVAAPQYPPQAIYPPPQAPYLPPQPTYSQQPPSYPQY